EADEVVAGVRLSYQKGDSNLLDLLCAQRDYNEVQKGYAEAVKELFAALIELQRSCGVGYDV
ncbi:MAG: TolC family protein, partial [Brevinema sp.]